jgi:hypothetical protein
MLVEKVQPKRGMVQVAMAVLGAALIISPSFLARILVDHTKIGIGSIAVMSLALFLVGAYLIITLLKE